GIHELDARFRAPPRRRGAPAMPISALLELPVGGDEGEEIATGTSRTQRVAAPDVDAIVHGLTQGAPTRLRDLKRGTGGPAGIFLIWYRDQPLFLGRARKAAREAKASNRTEADGVRGRLRGITRQP